MLLEKIEAIIAASGFTDDPASQPRSLTQALTESQIVTERDVEILHVIGWEIAKNPIVFAILKKLIHKPPLIIDSQLFLFKAKIDFVHK